MEESGLTTVQLSSTRSQSEAVRPPRALYCSFPLGRPLGKPNDAPYQRKVLDAAFRLLDRTSGPVLEDFPDTIQGEADEPFACPLPPIHDPSLPRAVDEAVALRPAYERQLAVSGRTVVGKVFEPDQIPDVVALFVRVAEGATPWQEIMTLGVPRLVAQDVRGYFEEAAMALADHVAGANQPEAWFFRKTAAGEALRKSAIRMREGGANQADWGFIVPRVYLE
jgi:hypothetical protein